MEHWNESTSFKLGRIESVLLVNNVLIDIMSGPEFRRDYLVEALREYGRPHRFHHGVNHLVSLFKMINDSGLDNYEKEILMIVALFHDVVYDPRSKTNELDSYNYFMRCIPEDKHKHGDVVLIGQMILDTNYSDTEREKQPLSHTFEAFDFYPLWNGSILEVLSNEKNIMREYQYVSYDLYQQGRIKFLKMITGLDKGCEKKGIPIEILIDHLGIYRPKIGIYAGSFDPFHVGHMNILEQAEKVFDKVIIVKAVNPAKNTIDSQISFEKLRGTLPFHEVVMWPGLLPDYIDKVSQYADVTLVRGLRTGYDLDYEINLFRYWKDMMNEIKCIYFLGSTEFQHVSSSGVRDISKFDKQVAQKYLPTKFSYYTLKDE